jgi:ribonuclease P protein component
MPGFVLLVRVREDADPTLRLGITVTKKIGNAVVRNRMKRRFRALGRELLPTLGLVGADHVLIGREGGVERDYGQLREELVKALGKVARSTLELAKALPPARAELDEAKLATPNQGFVKLSLSGDGTGLARTAGSGS